MKKIILAGFIWVSMANSLFGQAAPVFDSQRNGANYTVEAANLFQEAQGALRMRRLSVARQLLQKIIKEYPSDVYASLAKRSLVEILRDLNEHEEAIIILKEMLEEGNSTDNASFAREMLLNILFDLQRFREGVELIEAWRKNIPNDIWLERQLAKFYLQTGRKDEAWMILETMLERTASPAIFQDLLELSLKSGEIEKLLKILEDRRTRYRSRDYGTFVADCYLALDRKDKAIQVIKETPDLNRDWQLLKKLADLQIDTGAIEDALKTLALVDSIVQDDWDTLKKIGHCLVLLKRKSEAVDVWRRPFLRPHFQRQDQYLNYTTVLIEHQMYEEALNGFNEARTRLGSPSLFAEEVATVLEALGRKSEALNEYIQVFSNGYFRMEVFNKLYESIDEGFNLEQRLRDQLKTSFTVAVRQALIEFYFRKADEDSVGKIAQLVNASGGTLDEFFFDRLNQEATIFVANFHFALGRKLVKARPQSTLALKVASLLLEMADLEPIYGEAALVCANQIAADPKTVDAELKAQLLIEMAHYAFYRQRNAKAAHEYLDKILQSELLKAAPEKAVEAAIFKAHVMICEENYAQADSLLQENHKNVEKARENIFAANPIGETDYLARILLEQSFLAANQGDMQKALDLIKGIVENFPESIWANDALAQALFITRTSIGDFSLFKGLMQARRLSATRKVKEADVQYNELISKNASLTALITEIQAEKIINCQYFLSDKEMLQKIEEFKKKYPEHFKVADLMALELYYLRRTKALEADIRELLQKFIDVFPADLRSGRYKKLLSSKKLLLTIPLPDDPGKPESAEQENLIPELPEQGGDLDLEQVAPVYDTTDPDDEGDY